MGLLLVVSLWMAFMLAVGWLVKRDVNRVLPLDSLSVELGIDPSTGVRFRGTFRGSFNTWANYPYGLLAADSEMIQFGVRGRDKRFVIERSQVLSIRTNGANLLEFGTCRLIVDLEDGGRDRRFRGGDHGVLTALATLGWPVVRR